MKNIEKYFERINDICRENKYPLACAIESLRDEIHDAGYDCHGECDWCVQYMKEWALSEAKPDLPKLTRFEKEILLNLEGNYNYICRDKDGNLYVYEKVPGKQRMSWVASIGRYDAIKPFNSLFDMVSWDDEWPTEIAKLLELEVVVYD